MSNPYDDFVNSGTPATVVPAATSSPNPAPTPAPVQASPVQPSSSVQPSGPVSPAPDATQNFLAKAPNIINSILTGAYSAVNTATLGLPDLITKTISPAEYQRTQAAEAAHPVASTVGTVAGAVAPMLLGDEAGAIGAGGYLAKGAAGAANALGVGKAASSLSRLVEIAKGGEGISKTSQAFAQSLLQSVPAAVVSGATTGNWSQAGQQAALGTVGGGLLGAAVGKIAGKAPNIAEAVSEDIDKNILSASGVNTKIIKAVENSKAKIADVNIVGSSLNSNTDLMRHSTG